MNRASRQDQIVGRAPEVAALHAEVERVRTGEPRLVVISGEAGIGKACLAHRVVSRNPDLRVLRSTGSSSETDMPYGVVGQLGRAHARDVLTQLGPAGPLSPPHAVGAAVLAVLGELQDSGPVALVLDDAH